MNQRKAGVVLSYISMSINIIMGFIYVPILLGFLGKSQYGLYQLMGSIIAYMAVMDFGLSGTITRFYSRYLALKDERNQANVLAISGIIYCALTTIMLLIGVIIYNNLGAIFFDSLTMTELSQAKVIFVIMLFNVGITIPSNIFTAIINSNEKFVFIRMLSIIQNLIKPFVIIAVMSYRADAIALVIVQSLFNVSVILIKGYFSMFKLKVQIRLYSWDRQLVKEIMIFAFFIFMNMIIDQIYWKTDQIILGIISGTSAVAVYAIASQLNMFYMSFSGNINSVFLPRISAIVAKTDDMDEINGLFNKIGRIQFSLMSLILTGFILFGKSFIGFWAGKDFENAYYMSIIVMIPLMIPLIENMGIIILQAKNKHAFRTKVYLIIAILNIFMTIPLAKIYGGIGCAIATGIALFIGNGIIINIYYYRVIKIDIINFFEEIGKMTIPVTLVFLIGYIGNYFIETSNILILFLKIIIYSFMFYGFMWKLGFNEYEKNIFIGIKNKLLNRRI